MDDAIGPGIEVVRKGGAIIKNKYGENPAVLAEWTSVSHTERAPAAARGRRNPTRWTKPRNTTSPPAAQLN